VSLTLYSYFRSTSSWRVRIALAWKQQPFTYAAVHLLKDGGEQWKPEYVAKNPQGMVPLLEIDEGGASRSIAQSVAIIEYLEERFPEPPLLPKDVYLRARSRQLVEIVNSSIQPFQNLAVMKRIIEDYKADEKVWVRGFIERGLAAYEEAVAATAGRYTVGDAVSFADLFLVPQLTGGRRFDVDLARYPRCLAIEAASVELPAFVAAHPDRQPDAPRAS
jgi:maleylpyruvate isomerase